MVTGIPVDRMNMNEKPKILITGASGFIGSHFTDYALAHGFEVWAGVREHSSRRWLKDPRLHFLVLNMEDEGSLRACLAEMRGEIGRWDFIIHAAGLTKCVHREEFDEVNFEDTRRLVDTLRALDMTPAVFAYISSLSVYGPVREQVHSPSAPLGGTGLNSSSMGLSKVVYKPIGESDSPSPNTAYGESKVMAEEYIRSLDTFPWVIFRPTGVYGPRERDYFLMAKSIQRHIDVAVGYKPQELTFVYVEDLAQAVFLAFEKKCVHRAYFVSDGSVYSSRTFSDLLQKEMGVRRVLHLTLPLCVLRTVSLLAEKWASLNGKASTLNRDKYKIMKQRNWQCDIRPLIDELGYIPHYPLERGVSETVAWYKKEGWL